jgi:DNA adenine methylase
LLRTVQYLGGKSRLASKIAAVINTARGPREFWDPFCGGLSVSVALGGRGLITDANPALIALYQAVAAGWDPPQRVSESEYHAARALPDADPLKAFCGFGCSFGGKWFRGYARQRLVDGRWYDYAAGARNALLRDVPALIARGCRFACVDFLAIEPRPTSSVLYLDPPYLDTEGYGAVGRFDHARFYARAAAWSRRTDVFVSEYGFPWGRVVWSHEHKRHLSGGRNAGEANTRTERLYHFGPDRALDALML